MQSWRFLRQLQSQVRPLPCELGPELALGRQEHAGDLGPANRLGHSRNRGPVVVINDVYRPDSRRHLAVFPDQCQATVALDEVPTRRAIVVLSGLFRERAQIDRPELGVRGEQRSHGPPREPVCQAPSEVAVRCVIDVTSFAVDCDRHGQEPSLYHLRLTSTKPWASMSHFQSLTQSHNGPMANRVPQLALASPTTGPAGMTSGGFAHTPIGPVGRRICARVRHQASHAFPAADQCKVCQDSNRFFA